MVRQEQTLGALSCIVDDERRYIEELRMLVECLSFTMTGSGTLNRHLHNMDGAIVSTLNMVLFSPSAWLGYLGRKPSNQPFEFV